MLGESLQFWDYISTLLVIIGCTITTIFGPHICQSYTVDELLKLFLGVPFVVCEVILLVSSVCAGLIIWRKKFRVDYEWVNNLAEKFECPLVAFFAGVLGVQVNILMKCMGGMIQDDIFNHTNNYAHVSYWIIFVTLGIFTVWQLSVINVGLAKFEAVKFMPILTVIFILGCSAVGGIYYNEFEKFSIADWIMFPLGCSITLCGILLLTLTEDKAKRLYTHDMNDDLGYVSVAPDETEPQGSCCDCCCGNAYDDDQSDYHGGRERLGSGYTEQSLQDVSDQLFQGAEWEDLSPTSDKGSGRRRSRNRNDRLTDPY